MKFSSQKEFLHGLLQEGWEVRPIPNGLDMWFHVGTGVGIVGPTEKGNWVVCRRGEEPNHFDSYKFKSVTEALAWFEKHKTVNYLQ